MEFELNSGDSEMSVTVSLERLYNEIGEQGIMGDGVETREFFYLAALSLECYESDYDIEDVIMEFLRNTDSVDATWEEMNQIEELLR